MKSLQHDIIYIHNINVGYELMIVDAFSWLLSGYYNSKNASRILLGMLIFLWNFMKLDFNSQELWHNIGLQRKIKIVEREKKKVGI